MHFLCILTCARLLQTAESESGNSKLRIIIVYKKKQQAFVENPVHVPRILLLDVLIIWQKESPGNSDRCNLDGRQMTARGDAQYNKRATPHAFMLLTSAKVVKESLVLS